MGAYQMFVKAHYHDKEFHGMTPKEVIKGVAAKWRKSKGGAMTAGAVTGGAVTGGNYGGAVTGGRARGGVVTGGRARGGAVTGGRARKGGAVTGGGIGSSIGSLFDSIF